MAYAVLVTSSECELQTLVITLKEECENNSASLNVNKTKVLLQYSCKVGRTQCIVGTDAVIRQRNRHGYYRRRLKEMNAVEM